MKISRLLTVLLFSLMLQQCDKDKVLFYESIGNLSDLLPAGIPDKVEDIDVSR